MKLSFGKTVLLGLVATILWTISTPVISLGTGERTSDCAPQDECIVDTSQLMLRFGAGAVATFLIAAAASAVFKDRERSD